MLSIKRMVDFHAYLTEKQSKLHCFLMGNFIALHDIEFRWLFMKVLFSKGQENE